MQWKCHSPDDIKEIKNLCQSILWLKCSRNWMNSCS
jgi:hypothetical protein